MALFQAEEKKFSEGSDAFEKQYFEAEIDQLRRQKDEDLARYQFELNRRRKNSDIWSNCDISKVIVLMQIKKSLWKKTMLLCNIIVKGRLCFERELFLGLFFNQSWPLFFVSQIFSQQVKSSLRRSGLIRSLLRPFVQKNHPLSSKSKMSSSISVRQKRLENCGLKNVSLNAKIFMATVYSSRKIGIGSLIS